MPLAHQVILGVLIVGFILYPVILFYGWVITRGWEYRPDGVMPQIQWPAEAAEPAAETVEHRKAA